MYSKIKIFGHPIHPMLIAFPIAFYTAAFLAFVFYQFFTDDPFWYRLASVATWAGIISAVIAAIPGALDWALGVPRDTEAKRTGLYHMLVNTTALLFFIAAGVRLMGTWDNPPAEALGSVILTGIGFVLTMVGGSLGWVMIGKHKVGVELTPEQARLEPTEIQSRRARERMREQPV